MKENEPAQHQTALSFCLPEFRGHFLETSALAALAAVAVLAAMAISAALAALTALAFLTTLAAVTALAKPFR